MALFLRDCNAMSLEQHSCHATQKASVNRSSWSAPWLMIERAEVCFVRINSRSFLSGQQSLTAGLLHIVLLSAFYCSGLLDHTLCLCSRCMVGNCRSESYVALPFVLGGFSYIMGLWSDKGQLAKFSREQHGRLLRTLILFIFCLVFLLENGNKKSYIMII